MSENAKRRRLIDPGASKLADHPDRDEIVSAWVAGVPASQLETLLRERYPERPDLWVGDDQIAAFSRAIAPPDVERRVARGRQFVAEASNERQVRSTHEDLARLEGLADAGQRILEWHIGADALGPARSRPSAATERAYRSAVAALVAQSDRRVGRRHRRCLA